MPYFILALITLLYICTPLTAHADQDGFQAWLEHFKTEAKVAGIAPHTVEAALGGAQFIPRAIELDQKQPEKTRSFAAYRTDILSKQRVAEGREMYKKHQKLLKEIEHEYGVPASIIVALWGVETHYGKITGGFETVDVLATLAYEGRRRDFFKKELIAALQILQAGHISVHKMKGSWAGAMGQNQFMPTSFLKFAQDYDGDHRRDIWSNVADVMASSANYLNQSGWEEGISWGREVRLPKHFNDDLIGLKTTLSVQAWAAKGVVLPNGANLPQSDLTASIVRPADKGRQAYMVYNNYRVIMSWNKSTYFATCVGLLADQIAHGH